MCTNVSLDYVNDTTAIHKVSTRKAGVIKDACVGGLEGNAGAPQQYDLGLPFIRIIQGHCQMAWTSKGKPA